MAAILACLIAAVAASVTFLGKDEIQSAGGQEAANLEEAAKAAGAKTDAKTVTLLLFGDSLTAGYGLTQDEGFAPVLKTALKRDGYDVNIINAGVSGDTTAAGLARLEWSLAEEVDAVVVELGGNDALRGIDPAETARNLKSIIEILKARKLPVLLAGMRAPPNLGPDYEKTYNALFARLAQEEDVLFYPFFLEGVAADPNLNQSDGIHPNTRGVVIIVDNILASVKKLLEQARTEKTR